MRQEFADLLKAEMKKNKKIWVLLGGVGYGLWQPNERVINCEASEQAMVDMAVGLALSGQLPFVYCITPHLYRAAEGIRNYLGEEKIKVNLVGVGRGKEYGALGFTHYAEDVAQIMDALKVDCYFPENAESLKADFPKLMALEQPVFISLSR